MSKIFKGVWFLPKNREYIDDQISVESSKTVKGTLTISSEGFYTLETLGDLQLDNQPAIINGNTVCGKAITLLECFSQQMNFNSKSFLKSCSYISSFAIVTSEHNLSSYIDGLDRDEINKYSFTTQNFDSWLWNSNFILEETFDFKPGDIYDLKYKIPKERENVSLNNGYAVKLVTNFMIPGISIDMNERVLKENNFVELTHSNTSLIEMIKKMHIFLDFLTVCSGDLQMAKSIQFNTENNKYDLYYNSSKKGIERKILPPHMLLNYRILDNNWDNIINSWYSNYERMKDTLQLYFSIASKQTIFIEQRFLSLVQFLESYHRVQYPVSDKKIEEFREDLDKAFGEKISRRKIKSLKSKLKYGYEPSLEMRIKELLSKSFIINEQINDKDFSLKVSQTRNYRSHLGEKGSHVVTNSRELINICNILDKLSKYKLLKLMGFTNNYIDENLKLRT